MKTKFPQCQTMLRVLFSIILLAVCNKILSFSTACSIIWKISRSLRVLSLQVLIGTHTLCSLNMFTFSMVRALVIHCHAKHMPKTWCLGVLLCFQVQVPALAVYQLHGRTHLMDTASISLPLMGSKLGHRGWKGLAVCPRQALGS